MCAQGVGIGVRGGVERIDGLRERIMKIVEG